MSQQQNADDVSIDELPVGIDTTQSAAVDSADVPDESHSGSRSGPGWYLHGTGGTDPAFRWAIEWAHQLTTDTPSDIERCDEFLEYLVTVGFADERHELR